MFLSIFSINVFAVDYSNCNYNVTWADNVTYTLTGNNSIYCLNQSWIFNLTIGTAITFGNTWNTTLDGKGWWMNNTDGSSNLPIRYGINNGNSPGNNTVKNVYMSNWTYSIQIGGTNNTARDSYLAGGYSGSIPYGVHIQGNNNSIINVTADYFPVEMSGSGAGFFIDGNWGGNNMTNCTASNSAVGFRSANTQTANPDNNWIGGYLQTTYAGNLYLSSSVTASVNNNFTFRDFNFTTAKAFIWDGGRQGVFWWNNETTDGIWVMLRLPSSAPLPSVGKTINITLINTSQSNYIWNQTSSKASGTWNGDMNHSLKGLLPSTVYYVYNNSVLATSFSTDSNGESPEFTITNNLNEQHQIMVTTTALNFPPIWSTNSSTIGTPFTNSVFNVTWSDDLDSNGYNFSWFESNFSGSPTNYTTTRIGNQSTYQNILPAGNFYFKFYANDSNNAWNSTDSWSFTINKNTSSITMLYLNGTSSSRNYYKWQIANISATINTSYGTIVYLDMNATGYGNNFASGTSSVQNITDTNNLNLGMYNITAHFDGDQNYTGSSSTLYLTLLDGNANNFLNLEFNGTRNQNKTVGYNSIPINITGFSNLTDNQDLTFRLYNSTALLKTGSTATNITISSPGEYKYTFNTTGGQNYTTGSVSFYVSVWNATEGVPTQNTTLSNVQVNGQYNVTWLMAINLTNPSGFLGNVGYNYSIPSEFVPYSVLVNNSTNKAVVYTLSGNNVNFTTENISGAASKTENIYWICMNCLNDSETLITYGSSFYDKNITLTTSLTSYNVSIGKLIVNVPDQYSTSLYDMNLYRDDVLYTVGVSKISTDSAWNRVEITNFNFSSSTTFKVQVIQKNASAGSSSAPSAPSGPSGAGAGGGGGGEGLGKNFSFAVYPLFLQPDPYITAVIPESIVTWDINIYNYEVDIIKFLEPEWEFSCSYGTENYSSYCLADWCTFKPKEEGITKAPASDLVTYTLNCTVPLFATIDKEYRGTLLIWPRYYSKDISKPVRLSITPSNQPPIYQQIPQAIASVSIGGMMIAKEALFFNVLCLTSECKDKNWGYVEILKKPLFGFISGIQVWLLIVLTVLFISLFYFEII